MRVLSLSTIYPNEVSSSEGRSVAKLDEALAGLGVESTTLILRPWLPAAVARRFRAWKHLAVKDRVERRGAVTAVFSHYWHVPRGLLRDVSARNMAAEADRLIREHGFKFDLIHGQSIYPASLAASLLSERYGVPFVATFRDDFQYVREMVGPGNARMHRMFASMFSKVGAIFVHGPALLKDAPAFLPAGSTAPVILAPNGADVEGIEAILASLPPPTPHPTGHVVSVSRLHRFKGIQDNLRALRLLTDRGLGNWRYTIVGDGPRRDELRALAGSLRIEDRVTFVGATPHEEALRHIRDCDVYSMPSWGEPFGNVYAEAAICGKPVVGCRGQGAELTVVHGETGLLVPGQDVPALAQALSELLSHPEKAAAMGARGRERIRRFTWRNTAQKYKADLQHVIERRT